MILSLYMDNMPNKATLVFIMQTHKTKTNYSHHNYNRRKENKIKWLFN